MLNLKKKRKVTLEKVGKVNKILFFLISFIFFNNNVYAANDPLTVINNLTDLVYNVVKAIGTIFICFGIVQFGTSFKSHDPAQKIEGAMSIVGGILMFFAKTIINSLVG